MSRSGPIVARRDNSRLPCSDRWRWGVAIMKKSVAARTLALGAVLVLGLGSTGGAHAATPAPAYLTGTIVDETGVPVPDVQVELFRVRTPVKNVMFAEPYPVVWIHTAADGTFSFPITKPSPAYKYGVRVDVDQKLAAKFYYSFWVGVPHSYDPLVVCDIGGCAWAPPFGIPSTAALFATPAGHSVSTGVTHLQVGGVLTGVIHCEPAASNAGAVSLGPTSQPLRPLMTGLGARVAKNGTFTSSPIPATSYLADVGTRCPYVKPPHGEAWDTSMQTVTIRVRQRTVLSVTHAPVKSTRRPTVTGVAKRGRTLRLHLGTWPAGTRVQVYEWTRSDGALIGDSEHHLRLTRHDTAKAKIYIWLRADAPGHFTRFMKLVVKVKRR